MSAIITSIYNCPVKSISFQNIEKCKINKNIGIEGDRVFAFSQNLDLDQSTEFETNPETRKGKWNKIVTLKNTPVFNKYNFLHEDNKLTLTLNNKEINGPLLLQNKTYEDERGYFKETWNKKNFEKC